MSKVIGERKAEERLGECGEDFVDGPCLGRLVWTDELVCQLPEVMMVVVRSIFILGHGVDKPGLIAWNCDGGQNCGEEIQPHAERNRCKAYAKDYGMKRP